MIKSYFISYDNRVYNKNLEVILCGLNSCGTLTRLTDSSLVLISKKDIKDIYNIIKPCIVPAEQFIIVQITTNNSVGIIGNANLFLEKGDSYV